MAGTYKIVELVGTSPAGFAEATKAAIAEARAKPFVTWTGLSRSAAGSIGT